MKPSSFGLCTFSISCGGESSPIRAHGFDPTVLSYEENLGYSHPAIKPTYVYRHTYTNLQHYNYFTLTTTRFLFSCCKGEIIYFKPAPESLRRHHVCMEGKLRSNFICLVGIGTLSNVRGRGCPYLLDGKGLSDKRLPRAARK